MHLVQVQWKTYWRLEIIIITIIVIEINISRGSDGLSSIIRCRRSSGGWLYCDSNCMPFVNSALNG
jgi:hypothetical protein